MDTECEHGTRNGNRCEDCEALALLHAEIDRLRAAIERALAELAALRAERDENERGWQRTYDHDVALLKARAEKAEAERDALHWGNDDKG